MPTIEGLHSIQDTSPGPQGAHNGGALYVLYNVQTVSCILGSGEYNDEAKRRTLSANMTYTEVCKLVVHRRKIGSGFQGLN